ncbi:MAG: TlpA disulfide reductase family protein [Saprospiraceae bacterium]
MYKSGLYCGLIALILSSCIDIPRPYSKIPPGIWKGTLVLEDDPKSNKNDLVLPFNFEIDYIDENVIMTIINAKEKIVVKEITFSQDRSTGRDSIFIDFPLYDTRIEAEYKDNVIQGFWYVHYRENYKVPFIARHGVAERFKNATPPSQDISGEWNVKIDIETESEYPALGDFKQEGNKLTGTFMTETGDYRYLEGVVSGNELFLSCFDGAHAFYFDGKVLESGNILGRFFSGLHYKTNWTAVKNGKNDMVNAYEFSKLKNDQEPVTFSFPNTEGELVTPNSDKYKGKPKIVKLMGTWCPNCLDETNFLLDYLKNNPNKQIDIIALAFERYRDSDKAIAIIKRYKEKKKIPYEMLYAGYYDKEEATKTFKMLKKIKSYPTLIFLDKNNMVRKIYTGFSGPATKEYQTFTKDFDKIVTQLLDEE